VSILALSPLSPAVVGQQTTPPVFRGGVDLVTLDVSVLDKDRRPVKGLTAADFTVLDDGKPQPVVAFNAVDLPDAPALSAPWLRDIAPDVVSNTRQLRRIVVIVMDDANTALDPGEAATTRRIAHTVLDRLGEDDLVSVTFTDEGRWQNLTSNRALVATAIDSFTPHADSSLGATSIDAPPICSYAGKSHGVGACVIETLTAVADALASAPEGRKTVVYIGNGVPYDFSMTDLRGWRSPGQDIRELQAMLRLFQEANINVYAFDPCGVKCGIFGAKPDFLRVLSEETGGRATLGTNAPEASVPQMFVENSSYYLLGFRTATPTADGRFRRIQVRVNRPGVDVQTRSGYYAPLPKNRRAATKAAARAVDRALAQGVPGGGLPLAVSVAPVGLRGRSDAALAITVALGEPLPPGRHRVELVTTALDASCLDCKRQTHRQTIEFVPSSGSDAPAHTYQMVSRLPVKPGRYNVRVAAVLGDRAGSVFTDVEVPNFVKDPLSVSGLVVSVSPPAVTAQARLLSDLLPLVPSTTRDFGPGMTATAFVRVTQGGSNPPAAVRVATTIRDARDHADLERTAILEASAFHGSRSTDYRLELPIAALTPGPHLLTIELSLGKSIVRRDARFTVE
jgi:VWFA-related protein